MAKSKREPRGRESAVSWIILGVLCVITLGVYLRQFRYDVNVVIPRIQLSPGPGAAVSLGPASSALATFAPENTRPLNEVEVFGAETLSQKINGKAELYLPAGFKRLTAQRFSNLDTPSPWMEVFVYDMGLHRQAFSVFSAQRRTGSKPLALTPFSYRTQNAVFYVHGPYYVEIISSEVSQVMMDAMLSYGRAFVEDIPVEQVTIEELDLFPEEQLMPGSERLFAANAFGFDGFKDVFAATYELDGVMATGFLSQKQNPEEARSVAAAYAAFLVKIGGTTIPLMNTFSNAVMIKMFDRFELIFHHANVVAGVHDAESPVIAEELGLMIRSELTKARP